MGLHLRSRRLQSCSAAEASGGLGLKAPANCRLIGRWRIVESDLWDRAHLDLSGPATLTITPQGGDTGISIELNLVKPFGPGGVRFHKLRELRRYPLRKRQLGRHVGQDRTAALLNQLDKEW